MCGRPYPLLCEIKSGMDGADLLELSKQQLCTEVLLTPLAARKVIAARDEFLCP